MPGGEPRDHHFVPQFFLRNFAADEERTKVTTVSKQGRMAIWKSRSIKNIGFERDFYVHIVNGRPVSVETDINRRVETPISKSDTWQKISSGRTEELDPSDRAILYALVRHLEVRTPHFQATSRELANMAASDSSSMPFSDEERKMYALQRSNPDLAAFAFNISASTRYFDRGFESALITVSRSPIRLLTSTNPAMAWPTPAHPAMHLPLPGMVPFERVLALNPTTFVSVVEGDFDGAFFNSEIGLNVALGFNRRTLGHFAHFPEVRHLISDRERLNEDMTWAPYRLVSDTPEKIIFEREDRTAGAQADI